MSQEDCCCAGVVTKPCVCLGFVNCYKVWCNGVDEGFTEMCCGRYINCSTKKCNRAEIWNGNPELKDKYDYISKEQEAEC
jgi:hypothetical protein